MDRKRNTRAAAFRSQKIHHMENTFTIFAQCKKAAQRGSLFCDERVAG